MNKLLIITGANRGLGKAIVDSALEDDNAFVISLSRSVHIEHENIAKNKFLFIETELSNSFSSDLLENISKYISKNITIYYFNNASIISPINRIGNFGMTDISKSIKVNIEFPVNFINSIVHRFIENKLVFVNISSGAGKKAISYWSLYGASKAYMSLFCSVLDKENDNVMVYDLDPGVMDTGMQENIRSNEFPDKDYFLSLKDDCRLVSPKEAAIKIFKQINYQG